MVGVDAISLGVLEAPPRYGADVVCGELQGAGIHMHYGGGTIGFIASADDERMVAEYPTFLVGAGAHQVDEWGFGEVCWDRMAYVSAARRPTSPAPRRTSGRSASPSTSRCSGRDGLRELGTTIMQRSQYAAQRLGRCPASARPRSARRSSRSSSST